MTKKDGGPAYPCKGPNRVRATSDGELEIVPDSAATFSGMSLRDLFALQALPFCLREFGGNAEDQRQFSDAAYQIADAMLTARAKDLSDA